MKQLNEDSWTIEIPTKAGNYWFYGDPYQGSMGIDFRDNAPPIKPTMYFVEIFKISNGMMAKTDGQFVSLRKFDKSIPKVGCVGYWRPAHLPTVDIAEFDEHKLFN